MSNPKSSNELADWGLKGTIIYLVVLFGGIPVLWFFDLLKMSALDLNELGDFLAGAFGPLAIFWLVLGFFQQGRELQNSVDALKLQADELKNSVEQQRAMVGITKSQLELDIEVRNEQNTLLISKELPFLQLRNAGITGSTIGRHYKFKLTNIGADAQDIELSINFDAVGFGPKKFGFTQRTSQIEFAFSTNDLEIVQIGAGSLLTIVSRNIRGQTRTQEYEIGNFEPHLLSCDPEQV